MRFMPIVAMALVVAGFCSTAIAQQQIVDKFERRALTQGGHTLPYRLFVPADYDSTVAYPLVLALHGAGERGTDNERHIQLHRLATSWADPANQANNPTFVVAPQAPPSSRWTMDAPVDQSDLNANERTTLAILDSLIAEFNIDVERLYITGLSMGGHGVWDLISRLPYRFAAAVPMSGNADPTQAEKLPHMPIWSFHGESDTVVRPRTSRDLIQRMEDLGRNVVYTDCRRSPVRETNFDCPGTIASSMLAERICDRADLIFTSVRNGGHGPWTVWYDHPLLHEWLFSKRRIISDGIALTEPQSGQVWAGQQEIMWTGSGEPGDSVEIWLSVDAGMSWQEIGSATFEAGSFSWDTGTVPDAAVTQLRLFVVDNAGRVYGKTTSAPFTLDNDGDAPPFLYVDDEPLRFNPNVRSDIVELDVIAADPEGETLTADLFYSMDGGLTFMSASSAEIQSSPDPQSLSIDVTPLPNSSEGMFKVEVGDGANSVQAQTAIFSKRTERVVNDYVEHVQGEGVGTITLHFIEPENLTGHRYRITFDKAEAAPGSVAFLKTETAQKTYTVTDVDLGAILLTDIPLSDGILESPLFDGMSLVVEDLEVGMPDLEKTSWIEGDTDLSVSIVGGSVLISVLRVDLLETEDEYEIEVTESVADTSIAGFGQPAVELFFTVNAGSDGSRRKVLYKDDNGDGKLGGGDVLYILEPDGEGDLAPAWELRFSQNDETIAPEAGDIFRFVPVKRLGPEDVFEFIAMEGVDAETAVPTQYDIGFTAYPNPFSNHLSLSVDLDRSSIVKIAVFDVLGRRVADLFEGSMDDGPHILNMEWSDAAGASIANGFFVIRMTALPLSGGELVVRDQTVMRID